MGNTSTTGRFNISVEPLALRNLLGLLAAMPKETQALVRDNAQPLSMRLKGQLIMSAEAAPSPQARLMIGSISTPRDRLIRVDIGGTKKVGRKYGGEKRGNGKRVKQTQAPAGALLWGSEYGSHAGTDAAGRRYTNRFKASRNARGSWITPAVDNYVPVVAAEYVEMIKRVAGGIGKVS
jgi:hypothetical protein